MPRRIRSRQLAAWRDPESVFRAWFAEAPYAVWLDGGAEAVSGVSIIAAAHRRSEFLTADAEAGTVTRSTPAGGDLSSSTVAASVFDALAERLPSARDGGSAEAERPEAGDGGPLGWFGWFGYELGARLNDVATSPAETPDAAFLFVDRAVVFDHGARTVRLVWLEADGTSDDGAERWSQELATALEGESAASAPPTAPVSGSTTHAVAPSVRWRHGPERYAELIAECQAAIVRGDAYQLCLTNRVDVDVRPDPATAYLALRGVEPEPSRGIPAVRRGRAPERVARAVPPRRCRRGGLDQADEGHAPARSRREDSTPSSGANSSRARRSAPRTS